MLRNLAAIMIRPREVMRRILDGGRDRMMLPIVLLASFSIMLGDLDSGEIDSVRRIDAPLALVVIGIILGVLLLSLGFFYLMSWAAYGLGKVMEGTGTAREVRSAMAWGSAPVIWALLYRLPIAILLGPRIERSGVEIDEGVRLSSLKFGSDCLSLAGFAILELICFIWLIWVSSNTVGEAHRFSSWRGLATLALVAISPAIITVAAVLAM